MAEQIIIKRCSVCKQIKPLAEFYKDKRHSDNHCSDCKICRIQRTKRYSQTNKGKAAQKRYWQSPKGKTVGCKAKKKYAQTPKGKIARKNYDQSEKGKIYQKRKNQRLKDKYPQRFKARYAVNNAIKAGRLSRINSLFCHYCHKPAQQYHHWHGYAPEYRLDVVPACQSCDIKAHRSSFF